MLARRLIERKRDGDRITPEEWCTLAHDYGSVRIGPFEWNCYDWSLSNLRRKRSDEDANVQVFALRCVECRRFTRGCSLHWFCGLCRRCEQACFDDQEQES